MFTEIESSLSLEKETFSFITILLKGILILSIAAQIKINLPWTPVPITGQTFAVALLSLHYGKKYAPSIVGGYLLVGFLGLPVFANFSSGLSFGPTFGYLVGMLLSSFILGAAKELNFTSTFMKTLFSCYIASFVTFTCGLFVLSFFVPKEALLMAGLIPFLIGDFLKNLLVASLIQQTK